MKPTEAETIPQLVAAAAATRAALDAGHAKGKMITLKNATTSLGIPLHPGAEKFYKEAGVLK